MSLNKTTTKASPSKKASFRIDDILDSKESPDNAKKFAEEEEKRQFCHLPDHRQLSMGGCENQPKFAFADPYATTQASHLAYRGMTSASASYLDAYYGSHYYGDLSHRSSPYYFAPTSFAFSYPPAAAALGCYASGASASSSSYFGDMAMMRLPVALTKRKGGQVRFTPQQTQSLERSFAARKYLSPEDRRALAAQLKLSDRQVKTWFQNRRAKCRRGTSSSTPPNDFDDIDSDIQSEENNNSSSPKRSSKDYYSDEKSSSSSVFVGR